MAQDSEKICEGDAESPTTLVGRQAAEGGDPKSTPRIKATRHPRWTRQETLVLVESKKMVESGEQICRFRSETGYVQNDPKWEMVSSLCQQRGVKRGAVQCRKRWGNLLTDFRKIKKWESGIKGESESFWIMRNDMRKQKKLPGFFGSVVYNVLDGGVCTIVAFPLTLVKMAPKAKNGVVDGGALDQPNEIEDEDEEDEAIVDGEKLGWSTEENINGNMVNGFLKTPPTFINEKCFTGESLKKIPIFTQPTPGFQREALWEEGYKRMRLSFDLNDHIGELLRRNSEMVKAHVGAQNIYYQLARDQRKQQTEILVAALGKLTAALSKIAEKP